MWVVSHLWHHALILRIFLFHYRCSDQISTWDLEETSGSSTASNISILHLQHVNQIVKQIWTWPTTQEEAVNLQSSVHFKGEPT